MQVGIHSPGKPEAQAAVQRHDYETPRKLLESSSGVCRPSGNDGRLQLWFRVLERWQSG